MNREMEIRKQVAVPSVLEPDFDLLRLDVGENRALANELLATHRTGLWALMVQSL